MPSYYYDSITIPREVEHVRNGVSKVARISYVKRIGERGAKWIVGLGRLLGNRFILEEEFMVGELIIKTPSYGMFAIQRASDGTEYDRGWILVPYKKCSVNGETCILY